MLTQFSEYINNVCGYVKEKSVHQEIGQELGSHLEELYKEKQKDGFSSETAILQTLHSMGNPEVVGKYYNKSYQPNNVSFLLFGVQISFFCALLLYGIVMDNRFDFKPGLLSVTADSIPLTSVLINLLVSFVSIFIMGKIKYSYILALSRVHFFIFTLLLIFSVGLSVLLSFDRTSIVWILDFLGLFSFIMFLYTSNLSIKGMIKSWAFLSASLVCVHFIYRNTVMALSTMIAAFAITIVIVLRCTAKSRGKQIGIAIASLLICFSFLNVTSSDFRQDMKMLLNSQTDASSYFSPGYNNMLIRRLLPKAQWTGSAQLSSTDYQDIIDWKYGFNGTEYTDIQADHAMYSKLKLEHQTNRENQENYFIEYIMPSSYGTDYLLLYSLLKLGILPTFILMLFILAGPVLLLRLSFKRKGKLSAMLSIPCSVLVASLVFFYILGNLGISPAMVGGLPLMSAGKFYLLLIILLLSIILSCVKFDKVICEEYYTNIFQPAKQLNNV